MDLRDKRKQGRRRERRADKITQEPASERACRGQRTATAPRPPLPSSFPRLASCNSSLSRADFSDFLVADCTRGAPWKCCLDFFFAALSWRRSPLARVIDGRRRDSFAIGKMSQQLAGAAGEKNALVSNEAGGRGSGGALRSAARAGGVGRERSAASASSLWPAAHAAACAWRLDRCATACGSSSRRDHLK